MREVGEVEQAQLHDFANRCRKSMAAEVSIVICTGEPHEGKRATGTAIASTSKTTQLDAMATALQAILTAANTMLMRCSGGRARLVVQTDGGLQPVEAVQVDRYIVEGG